MIIDCFIFFNEIDLLEIRLEELNPVVDKFVLIEANKTFAGRKKPLYFQEHKHLFEKYIHKIVYNAVNMPPVIFGNRGALEAYQRNNIQKALTGCNAKDSDIILISDADEIPKAKKIRAAVKLLDSNDYVIFNQRYYKYYLNWVHKETFWCGTVACKYRALKDALPNDIRWASKRGRGFSIKQRAGLLKKYADINYPHIPDGGWHLSFLGGYDSVLYRKQNFSHLEYDKTEERKLNFINYTTCRSNLHNNKKFLLRYKDSPLLIFENTHKFVKAKLYSSKDVAPDPALPEYLKNNKEKFRHLFLFEDPYDDRDITVQFFKGLSNVKMLVWHKFDKWAFPTSQTLKLFLKKLPIIHVYLKKIRSNGINLFLFF